MERIVELGDVGSVQLTVAPAQAGFNQIHLYLFDPDGRPAEIAEAVDARAEPARRPTSARSPARPSAPGPPTSSSTATTSPSPAPGRSRSGPASTASPRRPGPPRSRSRRERRHDRRPCAALRLVRSSPSLRALVVVVATAAPAAADAAGPSDFRSEVTGIVPAVDGVDAEIRGGDTFLEVTVDEGHTVIVEGYTGRALPAVPARTAPSSGTGCRPPPT